MGHAALEDCSVWPSKAWLIGSIALDVTIVVPTTVHGSAPTTISVRGLGGTNAAKDR